MRRLEAADLRLQQFVKSKRIEIRKINGDTNPPDVFTEFLSREEIVIHLHRIDYRMIDMHGNEIGLKANSSLSSLESNALSYDEEYDAEIAANFSAV